MGGVRFLWSLTFTVVGELTESDVWQRTWGARHGGTARELQVLRFVQDDRNLE
jgi:hypothetical protein